MTNEHEASTPSHGLPLPSSRRTEDDSLFGSASTPADAADTANDAAKRALAEDSLFDSFLSTLSDTSAPAPAAPSAGLPLPGSTSPSEPSTGLPLPTTPRSAPSASEAALPPLSAPEPGLTPAEPASDALGDLPAYEEPSYTPAHQPQDAPAPAADIDNPLAAFHWDEQERNPSEPLAPILPDHAPHSEHEVGLGIQVERAEEINEELHIDELLERMLELKGSDLHLSAKNYPMVRVHGEMTALEEFPRLSGEIITNAIQSIMTTAQRNKFDEDWELDFAYNLPGRSRFRVNVMKQRGNTSVVMRTIPWEIKTVEELGLPPVIRNWATLARGLVLVTGPTGSGKSTTLAAIIDHANRTRAGHIVTIEDPIEFVHEHRKSVVNQREVGTDTKSFADALKHVLRQDPDIILVGEMRDLETISVALTAAETGHLVFGTLHTQSAPETISRIIDVFPDAAQQQVRTQLAATIQGVACQTLLKTIDGDSRRAAVEIMVATDAIRNQIREGKIEQIQSTLQSGAKYGMQTLDSVLEELVRNGEVHWQDAAEKAANRIAFMDRLGGPEGAEKIQRIALNRKRGGGLAF